MTVIHKYEIPPPDIGSNLTSVHLPSGAVIRSVGCQAIGFDEKIYLWAEIPGDGKQTTRFVGQGLYIYSTGEPWLPDEQLKTGKFIGTVHMPRAQLVFHVYREHQQ